MVSRSERAAIRRRYWFWTLVGCGLLTLAAVALGVTALVKALDIVTHWELSEDGSTLTSKFDNATVEIREGSDLVVHERIRDSFLYTLYELIFLDPAFGPSGDDMLFGAANVTYTRVQAFSGIGFRVWNAFFIPIGGIFDSAGLFGETALKVLFGEFATWVHGPIIGTGPAILIISDESTKKNIKNIDSNKALGEILALKPRSFDWKASSDKSLSASTRHTLRNQHGFVAQEVEKVMGHAVHKTTDYLPEDSTVVAQSLIDYNAFIPELVAAVQKLWANQVLSAADAVPKTACPQTDTVEKAICVCNACDTTCRGRDTDLARACASA